MDLAGISMRCRGWWDREQSDKDAQQLALQKAKELVANFAADQIFHAEACTAFYDSDPLHGLTHLQSLFGGEQGGSQYNVIQGIVDTKASHLIRQKTRSFFLTSKGNREWRENAKGMTRAVEANEDANDVNGSEGTQVAKDGLRDGTGLFKVTPDYANHRVSVDRVLREEVFVDPRDARMGKPRQMMHRQRIDRAVLLGMFPDREEEIANARPVDWTQDYAQASDIQLQLSDGYVSEQVEVFEWWHLPSVYVDGAKREEWEEGATHDGRHMILMETGLGGDSEAVALVDEPWPLPRFPIVRFRPNPKTKGYDGRGVVDRRRHLQVRINKMLLRIDKIMDLHSKFTVYVNRNANVNPNHVATNALGTIIFGDMPPGQAIQHMVPQAVPGDYIKQVDRLVEWASDMEGLSELTMHAERPKSFQSGDAVRTLLDSESVRHTDMFREWETMRVELSRVQVDMFRLMAWRDPDFSLVWGDDHDLAVIKWKEIDLDDVKWRLRIFPTNLLPAYPAAKLEKANEMFREGILTKEQWMALMDYPDIQAIASEVQAGLANIEHKLDKTERGEGTDEDWMPHGFMPLQLAYTIGLRRLNELEAEDADDEIIDRVTDWLSAVQQLMASTASKGGGGGGGGPSAPEPETPDAAPAPPPMPAGAASAAPRPEGAPPQAAPPA